MNDLCRVTWHAHPISKTDRAKRCGQRPFVIWFTGLSGSGKSTLAGALEQRLHQEGYLCYLLDGDNVRHGLNRDLGFSDTDRSENIRRASELSKILTDAGLIVIAAFISPFAKDRSAARHLFPPGEFVEVFLDVPIEICVQRDPKGIYDKAQRGEIRNITGIDSDYEIPETPEVSLNTSEYDVNACLEHLLAFCLEAGLLEPVVAKN
jgi:adenylyl-sulfate kinase